MRQVDGYDELSDLGGSIPGKLYSGEPKKDIPTSVRRAVSSSTCVTFAKALAAGCAAPPRSDFLTFRSLVKRSSPHAALPPG
ncbi:hypothetical protein, partial [Mesorhizobium sp. M7A.F.Ca.CA.001.09.2.1]|uniref:hypothetical protein n=1 Tax=Mesorhizobium sp. M7A.F.Ca.CA.001.09.2.1 TaxID=2496719 RepID=UPI001FDF0DFF